MLHKPPVQSSDAAASPQIPHAYPLMLATVMIWIICGEATWQIPVMVIW